MAHQIGSIQIPDGLIAKMESLFVLLCAAFHLPAEKPIIYTKGVPVPDITAANFVNYNMQQYQLTHSELGFMHHSYQIEQDTRRYFLDADEEALMSHLASIMSSKDAGTVAYDPVKQEEYISVASIAFLSRYAIDAGMDQFQAYDLSDLYLQKVSAVTTIDEYRTLVLEAGRHFISEVKKARSLTSQSPHIEKCKQFVYKNLNKPFTLNDVSEYVGLTPAYLSGLFSKYENRSIMEYALQKRIEASQNMLKYSDYSISQIAYYFCFSSQSHFANMFKKYTGQTPSAFRKANKQV